MIEDGPFTTICSHNRLTRRWAYCLSSKKFSVRNDGTPKGAIQMERIRMSDLAQAHERFYFKFNQGKLLIRGFDDLVLIMKYRSKHSNEIGPVAFGSVFGTFEVEN